MVKLCRSNDELSGFSTSQMLRGMNVDQTKDEYKLFCSMRLISSREGHKKKLDIMIL